MIAPDPLPSGHGAAASAGSGACGAGGEGAAASSWAWAGGRCAQQAGSASRPARTHGGSGGGCLLGVSPGASAGCPPRAAAIPSPVLPACPGCPGHGTLRSPGLIPCAHSEEATAPQVAERVGSPQRHSAGDGAWWEVGCWYGKGSIHRLGGKTGKSQTDPHPDWPKNRNGQCLCPGGDESSQGCWRAPRQDQSHRALL